MLKCPACGRSGGPFRLKDGVYADGQHLCGWRCPCGQAFHAPSGAERSAAVKASYSGFMIEWNGHVQAVSLSRVSKHDAVWTMGPWQLTVSTHAPARGARIVKLRSGTEPAAQWHLHTGSSPSEISQRLKGKPLPGHLDPDLFVRILSRILA